jgi:hypothetical protein
MMGDLNPVKTNQAAPTACHAAAAQTKKEQHCIIVAPAA